MSRTILTCFTLKLYQLIYYSKKTHQKSRALSYFYKTGIDKLFNMFIFTVDHQVKLVKTIFPRQNRNLHKIFRLQSNLPGISNIQL